MKLDIQLFGGRGASSSTPKDSVRTHLQSILNRVSWTSDKTKVIFYDENDKTLKGNRYEYKQLKQTTLNRINGASNKEYLNMKHNTITLSPSENTIKIYAIKRK